MNSATELRREVLRKTRPSGDVSVDLALWDLTKAEIESGWLGDPMTVEEALKALGDFVLARRFAVMQKSKLRPIDDYS
eukprot:2415614-Amphidinium_carterae.1